MPSGDSIYLNQKRRSIRKYREFSGSGLLHLGPGRYRFRVDYRILCRPSHGEPGAKPDTAKPSSRDGNDDVRNAGTFPSERSERPLERSGSPPREPPERGTADFLEIMIADWRNGRVYTGVNLGSNTEIFCERSTLFTQLDLTLQAATDLEFRISLLGDCAVEVSEMKIPRREPVLPNRW